MKHWRPWKENPLNDISSGKGGSKDYINIMFIMVGKGKTLRFDKKFNRQSPSSLSSPSSYHHHLHCFMHIVLQSGVLPSANHIQQKDPMLQPPPPHVASILVCELFTYNFIFIELHIEVNYCIHVHVFNY